MAEWRAGNLLFPSEDIWQQLLSCSNWIRCLNLEVVLKYFIFSESTAVLIQAIAIGGSYNSGSVNHWKLKENVSCYHKKSKMPFMSVFSNWTHERHSVLTTNSIVTDKI